MHVKPWTLCGESILDRYAVKFYARALRDMDSIYAYIAEQLLSPEVAQEMIASFEKAICSLEQMPERGALRTIGQFAQSGYRQLFVKHYVIVYRVLKDKKEVHIVTVRYAPSNF